MLNRQSKRFSFSLRIRIVGTPFFGTPPEPLRIDNDGTKGVLPNSHGVGDHSGQALAYVYYGNEPRWRTRIIMRTVCAFAVATLICAATYETSHAALIASLTGIRAGSDNITLVYSHHYRHSLPVIIVPPTRRYGYQPYWWPQGQYHWSPYGLERWGYWCEPAGAHRLSC